MAVEAPLRSGKVPERPATDQLRVAGKGPPLFLLTKVLPPVNCRAGNAQTSA